MSLSGSRCDAAAFTASCLGPLLDRAGVAAWGMADCSSGVAEADIASYRSWVASGMNASMDYLDRYYAERGNPSLLLEGARSIICCAFAYEPPRSGAVIAAYALGSDYHEVVRKRLATVASEIEDALGCATRVCVDTAPLRERYWAVKCGVGVRGLNGSVIVPGMGSYMFLGEIITTAALPPTKAIDRDCGRCRRCVRACPAGALREDGTVDARRCLSYLTIEHRGEFQAGTNLHGRLYGCDACLQACPHNAHPAPCVVPELMPRPAVAAITPAAAAQMTQPEFSTIFSHSAIKRAKLAGLRRNALTLLAASRTQR